VNPKRGKQSLSGSSYKSPAVEMTSTEEKKKNRQIPQKGGRIPISLEKTSPREHGVVNRPEKKRKTDKLISRAGKKCVP